MKFLLSIKRELIAGLIVLVLFYLSAPLIRMLDPTAAGLDLGWVHFFVLVPLGAFAALAAFWLALNVAFKTLDRWIDSGEFSKDFAAAGPRTRLWLFAAIFATFLLTFGLISIAVFQ